MQPLWSPICHCDFEADPFQFWRIGHLMTQVSVGSAPSLGDGGLFLKSFKEGQHPPPHAAVALGHPGYHRAAAIAVALEIGGYRREGVHGVCPFDLRRSRTPWLGPRRRSLSYQTLLILDLRVEKEDDVMYPWPHIFEVQLTAHLTRCATHHTRSLHRLRQVSRIRLAPEHVTLEPLRAAVHYHGKGAAVVADPQEGEKTHLALPERLLPFLLGFSRRGRKTVSYALQVNEQSRNGCTFPFHRDKMLSVMWITVASHSSLSVEFMMLSIALFNTSIPVAHQGRAHLMTSHKWSQIHKAFTNVQLLRNHFRGFQVFCPPTHCSGHRQVTNVLHIKLLDLLSHRLLKLHWNDNS